MNEPNEPKPAATDPGTRHPASYTGTRYEVRALDNPEDPENSPWRYLSFEGEPVIGETLQEVRDRLGQLERDRVLDVADFRDLVIARVEVAYFGFRD